MKQEQSTRVDPKPPYSIVVGVDFSDPGEHALSDALRIAADHPNSEVHVLHMLDPKSLGMTRTIRIQQEEVELRHLPEQLHAYVNEQASRLVREGSTKLGVHIRIGDAVEGLLQMAADVGADLLVVGMHGRRGVKRLTLGSVAEQLVRTAPCPVLVSRPIDYSGLTASKRIAPACPDCLETRARTTGRQWWCEAHASANAAHEAWHPVSSVQAVRWVRGPGDFHGYGTAGTRS